MIRPIATDFHVLTTSARPDKETDPKVAGTDFHVLKTSVPPDKKTEESCLSRGIPTGATSGTNQGNDARCSPATAPVRNVERLPIGQNSSASTEADHQTTQTEHAQRERDRPERVASGQGGIALEGDPEWCTFVSNLDTENADRPSGRRRDSGRQTVDDRDCPVATG